MKWIVYLRSYFSHRNQKTVIMTRPVFGDVNGDMDERYNSEHFPDFDLHLSETDAQQNLQLNTSDVHTDMQPLAFMFVKMDAANASRFSLFLNAVSVLRPPTQNPLNSAIDSSIDHILNDVLYYLVDGLKATFHHPSMPVSAK